VHPGRKYMMAAVADANGSHWAHARPTSLPNPNSGLDATKLSDGRLLAVYNNMWDTDEKLGLHCPQFRCSLAVAVSRDDGKSWCVERCPREGAEGFTRTRDCLKRIGRLGFGQRMPVGQIPHFRSVRVALGTSYNCA
jgi:hypothetical protein